MTGDLAARIAALPLRGRRRLVAIAGAPTSGKSTLAERLVEELGPRAALVPMDGFHLDNRVLDERGLRPRKGAPETFDAAGFVRLVNALRQKDEVNALYALEPASCSPPPINPRWVKVAGPPL